jgi:hypothetical protein
VELVVHLDDLAVGLEAPTPPSVPAVATDAVGGRRLPHSPRRGPSRLPSGADLIILISTHALSAGVIRELLDSHRRAGAT